MKDERPDFKGVGLDAVNPDNPDEDALKTLGALHFLFSRSPQFANANYTRMRQLIQPAVDLRFCHVFYQGDAPRAAVIWAYFGDEAEAKFVTRGQFPSPAEWRSGNNFWIVNIIAPFGGFGGGHVMNWLRRVIAPGTRVRYQRPSRLGLDHRIVQVTRGTGKIWSLEILKRDELSGVPMLDQHLERNNH